MLCRYLQAAAALILYPDCSAQHQLMALVCRVPAQFLTPAMMRLATAAWHWICAAQPRLQVRQVLSSVDLALDLCSKALAAGKASAVTASWHWICAAKPQLQVRQLLSGG